MSRDQKLSLIIGFSVLLVVGMLISDHVSKERRVLMQEIQPEPFMAMDFRPVFGDREEEPGEPSKGGGGEQQGEVQEAGVMPEPLHIQMGGGVVEGSAAAGVVEGPVKADEHEEAQGIDPGTWYFVRRGQTLYGICEAHYGDGEVWRKVVVHNPGRVGPEGQVREGNRIFLPGRATLGLPAEADLREEPERPSTEGRIRLASERTYTVKKDDVLGRIAQEQLGTVRRQGEIIALNRDVIRDADDIRVGMVLRLPAR